MITNMSAAGCFFVLFSVVLSFVVTYSSADDDVGPVIPPSPCEVCKYLATELKDRLEETGKTKEVLRLGQGLDDSKKRAVSYTTSELRLIEALTDPHICDKILEYNVHKERKGSLRFAKGQSETFKTLHNLVNKGVKVDLGIPEELWDAPSAEVTQLQRECYQMVSVYEEEIEEWYFKHQDQPILDYLCRKHVLKRKDQACLDEVYEPKGETPEIDEASDKKVQKKKKKNKDKPKGDSGAKTEL